jgi:hypothetical protein
MGDRRFGQEANVSATIVRQTGRPNLRLVADHGRIIPDPRGPVRIVAPRMVPAKVATQVATRVAADAAFRPPARKIPQEVPPRRVAAASLRLTRRGRLAVTVAVILLVAVVPMVLAVRGYPA